MRKLITLLGVAFLALATPAAAQPVSQNAISGNECWQAGQGPGGPGAYLCIPQVRNGTALKLFSGAGAQTYTAVQADSTLYWVGTAPTTWAVTLPSPAFDGEVITIATDTTLTTMLTVTAGSGQTMNAAFASQTLTANTSVEWQFNAASLKWYRIR